MQWEKKEDAGQEIELNKTSLSSIPSIKVGEMTASNITFSIFIILLDEDEQMDPSLQSNTMNCLQEASYFGSLENPEIFGHIPMGGEFHPQGHAFSLSSQISKKHSMIFLNSLMEGMKAIYPKSMLIIQAVGMKNLLSYSTSEELGNFLEMFIEESLLPIAYSEVILDYSLEITPFKRFIPPPPPPPRPSPPSPHQPISQRLRSKTNKGEFLTTRSGRTYQKFEEDVLIEEDDEDEEQEEKRIPTVLDGDFFERGLFGFVNNHKTQQWVRGNLMGLPVTANTDFQSPRKISSKLTSYPCFLLQDLGNLQSATGILKMDVDGYCEPKGLFGYSPFIMAMKVYSTAKNVFLSPTSYPFKNVHLGASYLSKCWGFGDERFTMEGSKFNNEMERIIQVLHSPFFH